MSAEIVAHPLIKRLRRQASDNPEQMVEAVRGALQDVLAEGHLEEVAQRAMRKVAGTFLPSHLIDEALR